MENGGEATSRHPASSCGGRTNILWLLLALHPHERHTILNRFVILWVLDLRPVRPPPPPDCPLGRICLLHRLEEILDELRGLRRDCRRGIHVHRRPHRRRLALSHTLPHGPHRPRNLWSPPAICLIRCCSLSIDVLLSGPVLALEDGRRGGGLAIEKRDRRDGGFGMEMMERRGGGFAMEKIRRGRGEMVVLEWR